MRLRTHIGLLSFLALAIAPCSQQGVTNSQRNGLDELAQSHLAFVETGPVGALRPTVPQESGRRKSFDRADLSPSERSAHLDRVALERFVRRARTLSPGEREALVRTIEETCAEHHIAPALVIAVIEVESAYDPHIVSPVGALGLMQVMLPTGQEMAQRLDIPWRGPQTLFDPETNIKIGTAYLRQLIDRYGSVRTALVAYNWGPGRIDRRIKRGSALPVVYADQVTRAYSRATAGSVGS